jgi:hypothetical protein
VQDKHVKFRSVAERRVSTLIKSVRKLSDLANRRLYDYTSEEVVRVFNAVNEELIAAQEKFAQPPPQKKPPPNFTFD